MLKYSINLKGKAKMKNYKYILFDLDGTITDSSEGVTNAVAYALDRAGLPYNSKDELKKFIGPPLKDGFMRYYGVSESEALSLIEVYREYYSVKGVYENTVYDRMEELLCELKASGKTLIVATSKPEYYSGKLLERAGLAKYFDMIAGATMDSSRVKKEDVIKYALDTMGISDKAQALMIGDRHHDVDGAKAHGIDCMGVLFGFGTREELEEAGACCIAQTVNDIAKFLI